MTRVDAILDAYKELKIRMLSGESFESALNNTAFEDLTEEEQGDMKEYLGGRVF